MKNSHKVAALLSALLAIPMTGSVVGKLLQTEQMQEMFQSHGLGAWLLIIGVGELLSLLAFLAPRTRPLGSLLLSSYFGGAILFHMSHAEPFLVPIAFLLTTWLITWLWGDWRANSIRQ
jgi:hypothetical protein